MNPAETQVAVVAHFTARPGKETQLLALLHSLIEPTRREPGCLRYELNQEIEDQGKFTFSEKFLDRESFESHLKAPHVQEFLARADDLVKSREIRLLKEMLPVRVGGESANA